MVETDRKAFQLPFNCFLKVDFQLPAALFSPIHERL